MTAQPRLRALLPPLPSLAAAASQLAVAPPLLDRPLGHERDGWARSQRAQAAPTCRLLDVGTPTRPPLRRPLFGWHLRARRLSLSRRLRRCRQADKPVLLYAHAGYDSTPSLRAEQQAWTGPCLIYHPFEIPFSPVSNLGSIWGVSISFAYHHCSLITSRIGRRYGSLTKDLEIQVRVH